MNINSILLFYISLKGKIIFLLFLHIFNNKINSFSINISYSYPIRSLSLDNIDFF